MRYFVLILVMISTTKSESIKTGIEESIAEDRYWFLKNDINIISVQNSSDGKNIVLFKTDGNDIISRSFDGGNEESTLLLVKISNSSFLLINQTRNPDRNFVITKMDYDFNILATFYTYQTGFSGQDLGFGPRFSNIDFRNDEKFVIAGWITHNRHFVMELDTNLNLVNKISYLDPLTSVMDHVFVADSGISTISSLNGNKVITKLDNELNILKSHKIPELSNYRFYFKNYEIDGMIYLLNRVVNKNEFVISQIDSEGNFVKLHRFNSTSSITTYSFNLISDELVITGVTNETNKRNFIITLDDNLEIEKQLVDNRFNQGLFTPQNDWGGFAAKHGDTITFFEDYPCDMVETDFEFTKSEITTFSEIASSVSKISDIPTSNEPYWTNITDLNFEIVDNPCDNKSGPCPTYFNYPSTSIDEFESHFDGTETQDNKLLLTDSTQQQAGAINYVNPIDLTDNFETEFEFTINGGYNAFNDGSLDGADGIVLLFGANKASVDKSSRDMFGGKLAYNEVRNALAIEIDTYILMGTTYQSLLTRKNYSLITIKTLLLLLLQIFL
ncbi:hypothetical protein OAQ99_01720 [Candidatus Kapabacteria bacterium]|nr:hypothetical protein [Candidatus Kapabacteria bacterium]